MVGEWWAGGGLVMGAWWVAGGCVGCLAPFSKRTSHRHLRRMSPVQVGWEPVTTWPTVQFLGSAGDAGHHSSVTRGGADGVATP